MTTTEWSKPVPTPSPLTRPFGAGTKRGELLVQRCPQCGHYVWTPQLACNKCLSESLEWTPVSGQGTVYSFTVMHRAATPAFTAPYVVAIVELAEGPRLMTNIVEIVPNEVRIGLPVEVTFDDIGEVGLFYFRPRR